MSVRMDSSSGQNESKRNESSFYINFRQAKITGTPLKEKIAFLNDLTVNCLLSVFESVGYNFKGAPDNSKHLLTSLKII